MKEAYSGLIYKPSHEIGMLTVHSRLWSQSRRAPTLLSCGARQGRRSSNCQGTRAQSSVRQRNHKWLQSTPVHSQVSQRVPGASFVDDLDLI